MTASKIKKSLLEIASRVKSNTTIEEVYEQLALLSDIEKSEQQEKEGKVFTQKEVEKKAKKWLK
jgi:predicted transcriptional regulator